MKIQLRSVIFTLLLIVTPLTYAVLDLPKNLVDLSSQEGQNFLENSRKHSEKNSWKRKTEGNTLKLLSNFTTQNTTTYCGVASLVMILNSSNLTKPDDLLHVPFHYFTQDNFFNPQVEAIVPADVVKDIGITLDQLTSIANSFDLPAKALHANEIGSLKHFRKELIKALSKHQFVVVNFSRDGLGQVGGGHHSPLAAYDEKNDRFLLLDVARYKYPPYWVKTEDLWNGVNTTDNDAKATRGIIVIDRDFRVPAAPRT